MTAAAPLNPRRRYRLTVAYDGSAFHGWQRQEPPGREPLRTVQGELEHALVRVLRQPRDGLALLGASRTDTGVHALGQVCHFDAATPIPLDRMAKAVSSRLPGDIDILDAAIVPDTFDAIGGVVSKQYRYRLFNASRKPLGIRHLVHHEPTELDPYRMHDAAGRLVGTHDVEGFAAVAHGRTTTVRTIHACAVERLGEEIHITVSGSGFLYHMVRIIAGTLVEVGRGRFQPGVVDEVLATRDRRRAGPTLPPSGLCLEWVRYTVAATGGGSPADTSRDPHTPR